MIHQINKKNQLESQLLVDNTQIQRMIPKFSLKDNLNKQSENLIKICLNFII